MQEIKRMETITQSFNLLQGLRVVPFGLFIVVEAAATSWLPWYAVWRPLSSGAALLLAAALSLLAHLYYRRNFGEVRPLRPQSPALQVGLILFGLVLMVTAGSLDRHYNMPVSLFGLAITVFLAGALFGQYGRLRLHHLILVLLMAGMSLLPLTGLVASAELFGPDSVYGSLVLGLGILLIGLWDHLSLTRALPAPPEEG
jgi:hypothetical protein